MYTSEYGWVIDEDHLGSREAMGRMGPRNIDPFWVKLLDKGAGVPFTLFDDDGILYYIGRIIGNYSGFEPLDDFGAPNAGCTEIRYKGVTL